MSSLILSGPWLNMGLIKEKKNFRLDRKLATPLGTWVTHLWAFEKLMGFLSLCDIIYEFIYLYLFLAFDEWKPNGPDEHALDIWLDLSHLGYTLGGAPRVDFRCCGQAAA